MEFFFSFFKLKNKKTKCETNDCEAGPSKGFEKDDSSMIKEVNKDSILKSLQSIEKIDSKLSRELMMNESFNISPIYHGNASNNTIHVNTTLIINRDSMNVMKNESSTIVDKTVTSEVFPNDKDGLKDQWSIVVLSIQTHFIVSI